MPSNRISLCMIVKDEEEWLTQCLESVQGAVDEIIVVDTGSSDRSDDIARQYGARIVPYVWRDDFAAARNAGLEQATGEWILFLDADEALDSAAREQLRSWTAASTCDGLFLNIHNYTGTGQQGATVNPVLRLFRNAPEHRFEGRIHEQIAGAICRKNPDAAFHVTDMMIHHFGYQTAVVERKDKVNRNLKLLEQAVEEEPEQSFHHYNLGVEYLRVGEAERALQTFRVAKAGIDPLVTSYAHLLFKYEVRCLQHLNRWQEALDHIEEALVLFPDYTDLLHNRGVCQEALGHTDQAEHSLREAIQLGPPPPVYHTEEGMGTYQTWYALGRLLEGRADLEGAVNAYVEAVRAKSSLLPPLYRIFRIMRVSGQQAVIPALITNRFALSSEEATHKIIGILEQSRCYDAALEMLPSAASKPSKEMRERLSFAEALLHIGQGRWNKARLKLDTVRRKKGDYALLSASWLVRVNWLEGRETAESDPLTMWLNHCVQSGTAWSAGQEKAVLHTNAGTNANGRPGDTEATTGAAAYEGWHALGLLMEGCIHSGKWAELLGLIQICQQLLSAEARSSEEIQQEQALNRNRKYAQEPFAGAFDTAAGAGWLIKSLIGAADHHLQELAGEPAGERNRYWPVIQQLRLELPGPDGFEM
ncbi:glycosyltransferase [Paenibacillus sp. ACRRY]|uniref:glycosyltransferase n=1 Tax=Paenibacillus sp. ACRRY TaxID=2918208 RepID=UPI001EF54A90|nr:glycosyltransferase [Paenibacillus sp. ACRRY]MCG7383846.1 glycosyltransferase [Paenibacillus sp. ACRRY]